MRGCIVMWIWLIDHLIREAFILRWKMAALLFDIWIVDGLTRRNLGWKLQRQRQFKGSVACQRSLVASWGSYFSQPSDKHLIPLSSRWGENKMLPRVIFLLKIKFLACIASCSKNIFLILLFISSIFYWMYSYNKSYWWKDRKSVV